MKLINKVKYNNIKNKVVLVRLDLNVPIENGKIVDDYRIISTYQTIDTLLKNKNKVIITSHLGESGESLEPVYKYLNKKYKDLLFIKSTDQKEIANMVDNNFSSASKAQKESIFGLRNIKKIKTNIIMLENLRCFEGEKKNSAAFAKFLASLANVYVYDAFAVAHRKHASVVSLSRYLPHCVGPLIINELKGLMPTQKINAKTLFILGGAKISTKLPLIDKYVDKGATVFVGGAMAHNIMLAQDISIGNSLYDKDINNKALAKKSAFKSNRVYIPYDYITSKNKIGNTSQKLVNQAIYDLGPETFSMIKKLIESHKTIIVNGPLGLYEKGYDKGSVAILRYIASDKCKDKITIAGGGDTVTLIEKAKLNKRFTFVSTGGGAMLYYMEKGQLPGIEANK